MKKILICSFILSSISFSAMKDGNYSAEVKEESRGWKTRVDMTVESGKITKVLLDDYKADGSKKSEDVAYNARWKSNSNVEYKEVAEKVTSDLLSKQDSDKVDNVAGATQLVSVFKKLSQATIENSKNGKKEIAIIEIK
ncbi:MAG: hypothetical protein ACRCZ2_14190 [Fusobacteriaceae bacterium]